MPLFEYKCEKCDYTFEKLIFNASEGVDCPKCNGQVHKIMSSFAVEIPDEDCAGLPKGEQRELCTECKQGGGSCPMAA